MQVVAARWREQGGEVVAPRAATDEDLLRVHDAAARRGASKAARGRAAMLDADTFTSPESDEVARLAAGAVLTASITCSMVRAGTRALVMVQAAGASRRSRSRDGLLSLQQHRGRRRLARARAARARGHRRLRRASRQRHAVDLLRGSDRALRVVASIPVLSGHRRRVEDGTRRRRSATRSTFRSRPAATDADFERRLREQVIPALRDFKPELMLVSAGFDAHERDPLGQMRMTTDGFGRLTKTLIDLANEVCEGRVVLVTEGGYDLKALSDSLNAVIAVCR